ncbi:low affinity immunoglobulin epsilon Fc receptor-like [Saccoglossus kowalevskii]
MKKVKCETICEVYIWSTATHFYCFIDTKLNWQKSSKYCSDRGGRLVTIDDKDEQDYLMRYFTNDVNPPYWTSLTDKNDEGTFVWAESVILGGGYSNWIIGNRPIDDEDKNCVRITTDGKWEVRKCSEKNNYICENDV